MMRKENIYKFFYLLSALLLLGFAIRLGADYMKYDVSNSAPFYVFVMERTAEFVLPAIIALLAGLITKKKYNK